VGHDYRRNIIAFWSIAAACMVVALAAIAVLDRPIAEWAASKSHGAIWASGTAWLDFLTLRTTSIFLLGPILMLAGGVLFLLRSTRRTGWQFLFAGSVQFASTMLADLSKGPIGRLQPTDAMAIPGLPDVWLAGGSVFPSGSAAFYAGLFFPLMLIAPTLDFPAGDIPLVHRSGGDRVGTTLSKRYLGRVRDSSPDDGRIQLPSAEG
jgi:hypothetical protein